MSTTNLGLDTVPTNTTNPSVPVNDAMQAFDSAIAGTATRNLATDANYTLVSADYLASVLVITDTGPVLTAGRDIVFPAHFPSILVTNSTAQTLTLKKSGQTGIALAAGESIRVSSGVTDVVTVVADAGAVSSVNGATGAVVVNCFVNVALSDMTTDITTGTAKAAWFAPEPGNLVSAFIGLHDPSSSGVVTVDMNDSGGSVFTTPPSIDATESTSITGTAAVLDGTISFVRGDKFTFDIDAAGTDAKGLQICIEYAPT